MLKLTLITLRRRGPACSRRREDLTSRRRVREMKAFYSSHRSAPKATLPYSLQVWLDSSGYDAPPGCPEAGRGICKLGSPHTLTLPMLASRADVGPGLPCKFKL